MAANTFLSGEGSDAETETGVFTSKFVKEFAHNLDSLIRADLKANTIPGPGTTYQDKLITDSVMGSQADKV